MLAQVIVDPTFVPEINNGGWVYNAAVLLAVVGAIIVLLVVFGYMRFAPRFQTDEGGHGRVRAPRVQPGKDVRRPVNVTSAPIVVQPPVVAPTGGAGATPPGSGSAAGSPPSVAPAPVAASQSPSAAAPAPAAVDSPPAPAPAPSAAAAEPEPAAAEQAPETAPAAAEPAPAPAPAPAAHAEVSLDQETFDRTLAELLEKGTDRRVAEGQARRAAMIAARKKAGG